MVRAVVRRCRGDIHSSTSSSSTNTNTSPMAQMRAGIGWVATPRPGKATSGCNRIREAGDERRPLERLVGVGYFIYFIFGRARNVVW